MKESFDIGFHEQSEWGQTLTRWHGSLEDERGDRAALKNCASPTEVVFVPSYHTFFREISDHAKDAIGQGAISWNWASLEYRILERLPVIAGLAAQVKEHRAVGKGEFRKPLSWAVQMAAPRSSGGGPRVSDLRFRRLLKCQTPDELYPALRRVLRLLENKADLLGIANDVFHWRDEVRKTWAYAYYAAAPQETE